MNAEQIRDMKVEDIRSDLSSLERELLHLRMANRLGTAENPLAIRHKRRTIARMKTILNEFERKQGE